MDPIVWLRGLLSFTSLHLYIVVFLISVIVCSLSAAAFFFRVSVDFQWQEVEQKHPGEH